MFFFNTVFVILLSSKAEPSKLITEFLNGMAHK